MLATKPTWNSPLMRRPGLEKASDVSAMNSSANEIGTRRFMKIFELGYPFLWKGRKSLACRRQAKRLSYRVQTTETHIDSGCAYFLIVSSPVFGQVLSVLQNASLQLEVQ